MVWRPEAGRGGAGGGEDRLAGWMGIWSNSHVFDGNSLFWILTRCAGGGRIQRTDMVALPSTACKHPVVRIVARDEDAEFVECQQCGEVFDSVEFDDMALEEQECLLTERSSE